MRIEDVALLPPWPVAHMRVVREALGLYRVGRKMKHTSEIRRL